MSDSVQALLTAIAAAPGSRTGMAASDVVAERLHARAELCAVCHALRESGTSTDVHGDDNRFTDEDAAIIAFFLATNTKIGTVQ